MTDEPTDTPRPVEAESAATRGDGPDAAGATAVPERRKRGGCLKKALVGLGVLLALLVLATVAIIAWKPWYTKPEVVDPAAGARRVTDDGLLANYYPAAGAKGPAVLLYGGSEGGIGAGVGATAEALRREGFSVLALSYWGGPGQPHAMERLPLETFDKGLAWLRRQPEVDPGRVALMGASKGGEATMLLAVRHPEIRAAVAYVPSSVSWPGIDLYEPWKMPGIGPTWSEGGKDLPVLPYGRSQGKIIDTYRSALDAMPPDHPAIIPVERAKAALVLVCGEADGLWPSCPMSRSIEQRVAKLGGPPVTVLAYPDAGHLVSGPPVPKDHPFYAQLGSVGGTPEGVNAARADSWPKVLDHLRRHLV